jgi:hypothetical protein
MIQGIFPEDFPMENMEGPVEVLCPKPKARLPCGVAKHGKTANC